MSELLGERNLEERLLEIKDITKRMDMRWDHGFFTNQEEYLEQRIKLQLELEQLTPVPDDDLQQAANVWRISVCIGKGLKTIRIESENSSN